MPDAEDPRDAANAESEAPRASGEKAPLREAAGGLAAAMEDVPDSQLAKVVIQSGMASAEAVKECIEALRKVTQLGLRKSLAEVMIEKGVLTENQARAATAAAAAGDEGGLLAGFRLIEKIGEGGMGVVYKAKQLSLDRFVALKILPEHLAKDRQYVNRFEREARMAAKLDHQNVVRAVDVGQAGGKRYFVMEYVDGKTVGQILDEDGKIPEARALHIVIQTARGLEAAWRSNLIHRDVKPDNIILTTDGVAKLADLGLAKETVIPSDQTRLTQNGASMGTPQYVSPEQATGTDVDIRSDIYSLGATFYHMVAGRPPFTGKDVMEVIAGRFQGRLTPVSEINPEVSPRVANVISAMMARDPKDRYPDPRVLLHDLFLVAGGQGPEFASPSQSGRLHAIEAAKSMKTDTSFIYVRPKRRRLLALLIGLGVAAVVGASAWAFVLLKPGKTEDRADLPEREPLPSAQVVEAACEEVRWLIENGEFEKAITRAGALAFRLKGGPGVERLEELRSEARSKLDEKRRREAEEKDKERRYRSLLTEAQMLC